MLYSQNTKKKKSFSSADKARNHLNVHLLHLQSTCIEGQQEGTKQER